MVVAALVSGDDHRPVTGLRPSDFALREDGKPQRLSRFAEARSSDMPLGIALVIDNSGSMSGAPLENAKQAAEAFLDEMGNDEQVVVVRFDHEARVIAPLGPVDESMREAIRKLEPAGGTDMYLGMHEALEVLGTDLETFRVVVALTDGRTGQSAYSLDGTIATCRERAVPVFTVGLGDVDVPGLSRLADETGGRFFHPENPEDLEEIYRILGEQLNSIYFLKYSSNRMRWDAGTADIEVEVRGATDSHSFQAPSERARFLTVVIPTSLLGLFILVSVILVIRRR
ncbi:MAG: VWA domain-containing protein [Armatimonadetes bacterium]|nr:VWA domain-containing protein [Armatimonadota bacterium]